MTDLGYHDESSSRRDSDAFDGVQGNIVSRLTSTSSTPRPQEATPSPSSSSFYIINNKTNLHQHYQYNNNNNNYNYYGLCLTGGVLSSSIRWILTPLDGAKCLMQVHPTTYPSISSALTYLYKSKSLYRGFIPTVLSYGTQTGTKYMMYEYIKDNLTTTATTTTRNNMSDNESLLYQNAIYVVSSFCAEAIADVLMCPWEMLKVQVQTTISSGSSSKLTTASSSSSSNYTLRHEIQSMIQQRPLPLSLFGSLPALWSRQIIGTVFNFLTFENCQKAIYKNLIQVDDTERNNCSLSTQLCVTIISGYTSGVISTIVSHPADTIISYKAKYPNMSAKQIVREIGFTKLATQGLGPRMLLTGSIIGFQWLIYDGFKSIMGMKH